MSQQAAAPGPDCTGFVEDSQILTEDEVTRLVRAATEARTKAYIPYSKFGVGAALLTEDGTIVQGANVENISYGLTICAERAAVCAAVVQGYTKFRAVAVVGDVGPQSYTTPCGACRQVLGEFGTHMEVYLARPSGEHIKTSVASLLPGSFTPDSVRL